MNRIDPEAVPDICRRNEIVPTRGTYLRMTLDVCQACAVGIDLINKSSKEAALDSWKQATPWDELKRIGEYTDDYVLGLSDGWEGLELNCQPGSEYAAGYSDGVAAWQACRAAGLAPWPTGPATWPQLSIDLSSGP